MLAAHEDTGHRPLPGYLEKRGLDVGPILVLVKLDGADLLCAELGEECLGLHAERAIGLGEDNDGIAKDELLDALLHRAGQLRCEVLPSWLTLASSWSKGRDLATRPSSKCRTQNRELQDALQQEEGGGNDTTPIWLVCVLAYTVYCTYGYTPYTLDL